MKLVHSYPAEVTATNGSTTGPFPPGPASTFTYTLDVTMDDRVRTFEGCAPHPSRRWRDTVLSKPWIPGTPVTVFIIGTVVIMMEGEMPNDVECPPGGAP